MAFPSRIDLLLETKAGSDLPNVWDWDPPGVLAVRTMAAQRLKCSISP